MSELPDPELAKAEAMRAKEKMKKDKAEDKAKREGETKSIEPPKIDEIDLSKYETREAMFVTQTARASVTHKYAQGTNRNYAISRGSYIEVDPLDEEYFKNKTRRNDHWKVKYKTIPVYHNVRYVRFNGTLENPHKIDLVFEIDGKKTAIMLKVGEWTRIDNKSLYDRIKQKSQGSRTWEAKTQKEPKPKEA